MVMFNVNVLVKINQNIYQCKRKVCKNADNPSIITNIPSVKTAQTPKKIYILTTPIYVGSVNPICNTMFHNTSDNSAKQYLSHMIFSSSYLKIIK